MSAPVEISAQLLAYINSQRVARLATADARAMPSLVPVCFTYYAGRFYIALDDKPKTVPPTRLKRVRNILANPNVALLLDSYYEDWMRLTYTLVSGTAALEQPGSEVHGAAISMLREKYPQYREMAIDGQPVIAITPVAVRGWKGSHAGPQEDTPQDRRELDFASLAQGRHVVRRFLRTEVPRPLVEQTLEAARWAPSPHGMQPWRFVVITQPELKQRLADAMSVEWRRNLEMDGESPEVVEDRLRKSYNRLLHTPVLIIPCLYMVGMHNYPDPARAAAEEIMAIQSLGAAVQNMLLSAYSLGLDTGWMCAPLFCPGVVRQVLALDPNLVPHALIQLGYAAQSPPRRPHRPISDLIVRYE
ncbi:MAG TPA: TIGR03668 family PPOX class F420-dependent oxidoreductase [Chloroflexia bacterium]